jgi:hypothetical protein
VVLSLCHQIRHPKVSIIWLMNVKLREWEFAGKLKYLEETCLSATLSTINLTWPDLGSNVNCHGGQQVTNRLSCGTGSDWSAGMWDHVVLQVAINISEEHSASIFRVEMTVVKMSCEAVCFYEMWDPPTALQSITIQKTAIWTLTSMENCKIVTLFMYGGV